jgi:hypothetical protein
MPSLVLPHDENSVVRFVYATDIQRSRSGKERRAALMSVPREYHEFSTVLDNDKARVLRGDLLQGITTGVAFSISVPSEALAVTSYAGAVLTLPTTTLSDWMANGRSVVVTASNGTQLITTVSSFTATTITLGAAPSAGLAGVLIMPLQTVQMDDAQQFGKYAVNAQRVDIKAEALSPPALAGLGATLTMHASMPVVDRAIDASALVAEALIAQTERVDFGIVQATMFPRAIADWARTISLICNRDSERQWIKDFFSTVKGKQKPFLLPTWTPDLTIHTQPTSTALRIFGPPTVGTTNYAAQWFASLAHRNIQLVMSTGTILYRTISAAVDNLDGTQTLTMNASVTGTVAMCSLLETCRLDDDELRIVYTGQRGDVQLQARVVQQ